MRLQDTRRIVKGMSMLWSRSDGAICTLCDARGRIKAIITCPGSDSALIPERCYVWGADDTLLGDNRLFNARELFDILSDVTACRAYLHNFHYDHLVGRLMCLGKGSGVLCEGCKGKDAK